MKAVLRLLQDIDELFRQLRTELQIIATDPDATLKTKVADAMLTGACASAHGAAVAALRLAKATCPQ